MGLNDPCASVSLKSYRPESPTKIPVHFSVCLTYKPVKSIALEYCFFGKSGCHDLRSRSNSGHKGCSYRISRFAVVVNVDGKGSSRAALIIEDGSFKLFEYIGPS